MNICIILYQLFLLTSLRADNENNVSIKLRTVKDMESWRLLQMQAKQDYFFRKRVMTHSTICSEPIYCEDSFMNNKQKSRLLNILNDHRNRWVEKSCNSEKSSALQLIWLWKAEINATINALGCQEGKNTTDIILDGDLNTSKYIHKSGESNKLLHQPDFKIYPGEESFWNALKKRSPKFPIREYLTCYPKARQFALSNSSVDVFLDVLESELRNEINSEDCVADEVECENCLYVGCSLTLTRSSMENVTTTGHFHCHFCDRNVTTNVTSKPIPGCPNGYNKSEEYPYLCQDWEIRNSFIDEQITRQYDCGRLEYAQAYVTNIRTNFSLIICLILIISAI